MVQGIIRACSSDIFNVAAWSTCLTSKQYAAYRFKAQQCQALVVEHYFPFQPMANAMKSTKKKSVSKVARGRMAKALVLRGSTAKTKGGLTAEDLLRNKQGKIVSKKLSAKAQMSPWVLAVKKARAALKIKGFCAIKKGTPLYRKARQFYKQ